MAVCSCKTDLVPLSGRLKNGKDEAGIVYACPVCDTADKPIEKSKTIIEISKENHGTHGT
jgi:hypothetical protein